MTPEMVCPCSVANVTLDAPTRCHKTHTKEPWRNSVQLPEWARSGGGKNPLENAITKYPHATCRPLTYTFVSLEEFLYSRLKWLEKSQGDTPETNWDLLTIPFTNMATHGWGGRLILEGSQHGHAGHLYSPYKGAAGRPLYSLFSDNDHLALWGWALSFMRLGFGPRSWRYESMAGCNLSFQYATALR